MTQTNDALYLIILVHIMKAENKSLHLSSDLHIHGCLLHKYINTSNKKLKISNNNAMRLSTEKPHMAHMYNFYELVVVDSTNLSSHAPFLCISCQFLIVIFRSFLIIFCFHTYFILNRIIEF